MTTSTAKAKTANVTAAPRKGKPVVSSGVPTAQQKKFAAVVGSIAKRYGVKVASVSVPEKNPYAMSAEQAEKISLRSGIITRAGNLTRTFK